MSASSDQKQKVTFIYQNFHHLYRKGLETAQAAPEAVSSSAAPVAEESPLKGTVGGEVLKAVSPHEGITSLRSQVQRIHQIQKQIRFMISEIDDLMKKKS